MGRYPKHDKTLQWAEQQVGKREQPPGSNTGAFVQFCQSATWLAGTGWPWCRAFVLRAHLEGGFTLPDRSAGAWDALDRARQRGDALDPGQYRQAIPGDEVIWAFGAGHSSILKRVYKAPSGGELRVVSIDGNVDDQVEQCDRPLSLVKGFIRWREKPVAAAPARKPRVQVVGSASGEKRLVTVGGRINVRVDGKLILRRQKPGNPAVQRRLPRLIAAAKRTVTIRKTH